MLCSLQHVFRGSFQSELAGFSPAERNASSPAHFAIPHKPAGAPPSLRAVMAAPLASRHGRVAPRASVGDDGRARALAPPQRHLGAGGRPARAHPPPPGVAREPPPGPLRVGRSDTANAGGRDRCVGRGGPDGRNARDGRCENRRGARAKAHWKPPAARSRRLVEVRARDPARVPFSTPSLPPSRARRDGVRRSCGAGRAVSISGLSSSFS